MNAAAFADGMGRGGRTEAKRALEMFWRNISQAAQFGPFQSTAFDRLANGWNLDHSMGFVAFDMLTRMMSPYQLNPTNYNRLRAVLEKSVDFKRNARLDFLLHLKAIGRKGAEHWIAHNFDAIGQRSTIDVKEMFL